MYLKGFTLYGHGSHIDHVTINLCVVSTGKHFLNTNLSDLSILGTCDIFVYQMRHQIM